MDKILSEEKQVKRKQQQQPQLWPDRQRDRVKVLVTSYLVNNVTGDIIRIVIIVIDINESFLLT